MNAFTHITDFLNSKQPESQVRISESQLNDFEDNLALYLLQDIAYGRAFCQHFGIPEDGNTVIYHMQSRAYARIWIREHYMI
jgi:hypothetical protein